MKKNIVIIIIVLSAFTITAQSQTKFSTETTLCYDKLQGGIPMNRLEINNPKFNFKYDYKVNLITGQPINDVFGIFLPKLIDKKTFNLDVAVIKLGDWNKSDEVILDVAATKQLGPVAITLELGRAIGVETQPWDFAISRVAHRLFTVEGGILSPDQLFAPSQKKLYGWVAYHPEHVFIATGNEISRNWFVFGTKKYKNFGHLTVADYDRDNGSFWFRSQFGFGNINQSFFAQDNYIISTSYLIVPPFFYKHFSPISTKGKYSLKLDGKRIGKLETYEISVGRQFGKFGQIAVGMNNENFKRERLGLVLEYYKEFTLKNFKASTEFRYEQLTAKFAGYIILAYQF